MIRQPSAGTARQAIMAPALDGKSPGTPSKGAPRLPAAIANATLEELQKMCLDTLKKLRDKDRRIKELSSVAAAAGTAATDAGKDAKRESTADTATVSDLQSQVHNGLKVVIPCSSFASVFVFLQPSVTGLYVLFVRCFVKFHLLTASMARPLP